MFIQKIENEYNGEYLNHERNGFFFKIINVNEINISFTIRRVNSFTPGAREVKSMKNDINAFIMHLMILFFLIIATFLL